MTDRYSTLATPVEPAKADGLRRTLHARLTAGAPHTDLITTQPETDQSEEDVLMSIEQLNRTDPRQRSRRARSIVVATGVVLAAAAAITAAVVLTGDDDVSTVDEPVETSVVQPTTIASTVPPVCPNGMGACKGRLEPGTYTSAAFEPAERFAPDRTPIGGIIVDVRHEIFAEHSGVVQ